jgi:hypothetical protein
MEIEMTLINKPVSSLTDEQLQEEFKRRREAKRAARLENPIEISAETGAIKLYLSMRPKFPITAYYDEWEEILGHKDALEQFIVANQSALKPKPKKEENGTGNSLTMEAGPQVSLDTVLTFEWDGRYFVGQALTEDLPTVFELVPARETRLETVPPPDKSN